MFKNILGIAFLFLFFSGCMKHSGQENQTPLHPEHQESVIALNEPTPGAFIELRCAGEKEIKRKYLGYINELVITSKEHAEIIDSMCKKHVPAEDTEVGIFNATYKINGRFENGDKFSREGIAHETLYVLKWLNRSLQWIKISTSKV